MIVGVGLRVWQYLANPSLWLDEILLVRNIWDRPRWDLLTTQLSNYQVAPKFFLLLEKLVLSTLCPIYYVLRLLPLFCSLIALVAFWRVARRVLDGFGPAVALALFATSVPFVAFASQVKQYSTDVAIAVLLLWIALGLEGPAVSRRRALWAGLAGAIVVWFSLPSVLVLAGLGASLALLAWRGRGESGDRRLRALVPTLALWVGSAFATILMGLTSMTPPMRESLHRYWADGFPPSSAALGLVMWWPWHPLKSLLGSGGPSGLAYPYPGLFLALIVLGWVVLWRRRTGAALLILAPIAVTLGAAAADQYPFSDRLILFLVPSLLLALGASIEYIRQRVSLMFHPLGLTLCLLLVGLPLLRVFKTPPAYEAEHMKPVLSYLQARRQPDDRVYAFWGALDAIRWYGTRYGLDSNDYSAGSYHRGDDRRYFEELDAFRGQPRVWILVTHALPGYHERDDILHYLDTIGVQRAVYSIAARTIVSGSAPAEAFLYDLSDTVRLTGAAANSFPLTEPVAAFEPR